MSKNIALFASAFHPHVGGVEELVRQLAHAYERKGHGAIVVTNRWPPELPEFEEYEGIPVYRFAMRTPGGSLRERAKYQLTHTASVRRMLDVLRHHKTDLLHVQCVSSNGYYAQVARRALRLPLVVTAQGERTMDAEQIYQKSAYMNRMLRALLAEADHITACSRHTLDDLEGWYGSPFGPRAQVVHNGIDLSSFAVPVPYSHPRPYILGIGRHVPQKGFDVLLQAFALAGQASHDLLLAGDGPERPALERLAADLKLGDRVRFVGRADRPAAVSLFAGCSFFVLPSRQEPQGIVNLEAMAAGKAVLATRVGGVPEIVTDGETGLLVPAEDVSALAGAIKRLTDDAPLRQRLGAAGWERAQAFGWDVIAEQYLGICAGVQR